TLLREATARRPVRLRRTTTTLRLIFPRFATIKSLSSNPRVVLGVEGRDQGAGDRAQGSGYQRSETGSACPERPENPSEPQPKARARCRRDEQSQPVAEPSAPPALAEHLGGLDRRRGERGVSAEETRREDLLPRLGHERDPNPRDQADEERSAEVDQGGARGDPVPAHPAGDRPIDPGPGGCAHT